MGDIFNVKYNEKKNKIFQFFKNSLLKLTNNDIIFLLL